MNLEEKLQSVWSKETSFLPEKWSKDNPARGQCAVTALVVQDLLGGEIIKVDVMEDNDAHFFNQLPNGDIVDYTRSQFGESATFENEKVADMAVGPSSCQNGELNQCQ